MNETTLWDPEPEPTVFPLPPVPPSFDVGVRENPDTWSRWVANGGDPRLYPYTEEEYGCLERWWLADMASLPTADVEAELEYTTRRLVDLRTQPDVAWGLIDGVQYQPILEARAAWLAAEIKRRNALPDPPPGGFKIPSDFVHRLKDACNLPDFLVGELGFTGLKRQGRDYKGLCPFHLEQTPSFIIHADRFHCFSCQQSGDVFDMLLVSATCRTWREAVEYVARYVGIAMPKPPVRTRAIPPAPHSGGPEPIWSKYSA